MQDKETNDWFCDGCGNEILEVVHLDNKGKCNRCVKK